MKGREGKGRGTGMGGDNKGRGGGRREDGKERGAEGEHGRDRNCASLVNINHALATPAERCKPRIGLSVFFCRSIIYKACQRMNEN